jgi:hypothetical protein
MDPARTTQQDAWSLLDIYRQRYEIDTDLEPVESLQRSIQRRHLKASALRRRFEELHDEMTLVEAELKAVEAEIRGSRKAGALLCEQIVDKVRDKESEGWSPTPILGFRLWRLTPRGMHGVKVAWQTPTLTARCMNSVVGDDIPHSGRRCGPPACGIYATKDLDMLRAELKVDASDGFAIGVVTLTGKVIEHQHGYRGAEATAVAVVARDKGLHLASDQPEVIGALFADHTTTLRDHGAPGRHGAANADRYLNEWKERNEKWTWDQS